MPRAKLISEKVIKKRTALYLFCSKGYLFQKDAFVRRMIVAKLLLNRKARMVKGKGTCEDVIKGNFYRLPSHIEY
jgi:hypothetical protein